MRALLLSAAICAAFIAACLGDDPVTTSPSAGSSGGPSARVVRCNDKDCATGEVCCLTFGESSIQTAECTPESACSKPFLACDGTGDCGAGEICCVATGGHSVQYGPSYCANACRSDSDFRLCRDSSECPSKSCVAAERSVTPTGLMVCTE
jgi:hypothetical protein